jgi:hypothetical protein
MLYAHLAEKLSPRAEAHGVTRVIFLRPSCGGGQELQDACSIPLKPLYKETTDEIAGRPNEVEAN